MKRLLMRGALTLLCIFWTLSGPGGGFAEAAEPTEYQVKAAFVYNFIKFIQWPQQTSPPGATHISLCVVGQDSLGEALESLRGKTVSAKKIQVKRLSGVGESDQCELLYLGQSERERFAVHLKRAEQGQLTIGDMPRFASSGGMINFIIVDNRVSFEINVEAAERAGMKISSQLLKLARIVRTQTEEKGR